MNQNQETTAAGGDPVRARDLEWSENESQPASWRWAQAMLSPCSASPQGEQSADSEVVRHAMADAGSTLPRSKAGEVQLSELVEVACKGGSCYGKLKPQYNTPQ